MTTLLLIVIYIAYIGLGLPDSLFGSSWPAIYPEMGLHMSYSNFVTTINCMGTIISSIFSVRIIKKLGTGGVTALSTAMTAAALLGYSLSGSFIWLCIFSLPLGLGAGAIDTSLNSYVALHYNATHMNFLHCFFGVGISLSPYIMSLALSDNAAWRTGYRYAFYIQAVITAVTICALPLWKKINDKNAEELPAAQEEEMIVLPYRRMLKNPVIVVSCIIFMSSCAMESLCNIWGATYLVNVRGLTADRAAAMIMFYYIGFTLSRFFSGLLAGRMSLWKITNIGLLFCAGGVVVMFLPLPVYCCGIGFFCIGMGIGPIFPNMSHLTPVLFGKKTAQSIISAEMTASYVSIMLTPILLGQTAQHISMTLYPFFLAAVCLITVLCILFVQKKGKCSPF